MQFTPFPVLLVLLLFLSCKDQGDSLAQMEAEIEAFQQESKDELTDSTVTNLYQAAALLRKNPELSDAARAYNDHLLGFYHRNNGQIDSASFYFSRSLESLPDTLKANNFKFINYFNAAWDNYYLKSDFGNALAVAEKFSRKIKSEDTLAQAWLNYFYAQTYFGNRDYENARKYNAKHIELWRSLGDSNALANAEILQININDYQGKNYQQSDSLTQILIGKEQSLNHYLAQQVLTKYAISQYYKGDFETARDFYKRSLAHVKQTPDSPDRTQNLGLEYCNLAEVSMDLRDYEAAQSYLDSVKGLGLNKLRNSSNKSYVKYNFRLASETNKSPREIGILVDSISNFFADDYRKKYSDELVELTKAYEKERELLAAQQLKEIENIRLENRVYFIAGGGLLLIGLGLLYYRQRKLSFERAGLKMQQRLLRSQMNPHFTSNTLYAIQRQVKEAPALAEEYLLKFSRLLRLILENSMEDYVLLEDELESLRKYMDLQLIRFPGKFEYEVKLTGLDEEDPVYIPPMLLQPFTENAIEHGFNGITYTGKLYIELTDEKKYLSCRIRDNGRGFVTDSSNSKNSASTQLISDFLTKVTGAGVKFQNLPKTTTEHGGTQVSFLIPIKSFGND
ncbi:tetratricopeptide repeat-containing sensor histidine kinase [Gilvibacter sp.]|uniref:tetratricopeptide repeat-containing sensor histidine kinase n=1 Tax=Gilvibacter sp. TaxID=2729997 RepID=UPI003F4A0AA8